MIESTVFVRVLAATALALAMGASCKAKFAPDEPTDVIPEACCKAISKDLKHGAGCRTTGKCAKEEKIWMRGAVTCTAVDVDRCLGGRCCSYRQMYGSDDAIYNWDAGEADAPAAAPVVQEHN